MRKAEKGFTLIEVVAAIALLAIVAIPLASVFMDSFRFQARSQKKTEVNEVAQFIAEQLKDGKNYYGIPALDLDEDNYVELKSEDILDTIDPLIEAYDIKITVLQDEQGRNISGSTPETFAYELMIDEFGNVSGETYDTNLKVLDYSNFVMTVNDVTQAKDVNYDILIVNEGTTEEILYRVNKQTPALLTFYLKGDNIDVKSDIQEQKPKEYSMIKKFNLKDKDSVTSKNEDLYHATITVTSRNNPEIRASMNTTFTIKSEQKEEDEFWE